MLKANFSKLVLVVLICISAISQSISGSSLWSWKTQNTQATAALAALLAAWSAYKYWTYEPSENRIEEQPVTWPEVAKYAGQVAKNTAWNPGEEEDAQKVEKILNGRSATGGSAVDSFMPRPKGENLFGGFGLPGKGSSDDQASLRRQNSGSRTHLFFEEGTDNLRQDSRGREIQYYGLPIQVNNNLAEKVNFLVKRNISPGQYYYYPDDSIVVYFIEENNGTKSLKNLEDKVLVQAQDIQVYSISSNKLIVLCSNSKGILSRVVMFRKRRSNLLPVYDTQEIDNNSYKFKLSDIQKVQLLDSGLLRIYKNDNRFMNIQFV
jgi:hypothetical protein